MVCIFDEATRKMQVVTENCVGCGRCVGACNFDAIAFANDAVTKELNCRMAEYTKAVIDGRPGFHISLVMDISPNCDCHPENDAPILPDIGMFCSFDPAGSGSGLCGMPVCVSSRCRAASSMTTCIRRLLRSSRSL